MKELELKYGCNPNQKPSTHLSWRNGELPIDGAERQARLHQFLGCVQRLAAGERAQGSDRTSGCDLVQACFTGRSGSGTSAQRR